MKANMVHSQFAILEEPTVQEWDCITIDCGVPQEEVLKSALAGVQKELQRLGSVKA